MARDPKASKRTRRQDAHERERTRQQLLVDLGLDEITYDSCIRELFSELAGDYADRQRRSSPPPAPGPPARIVQLGPGWRSPADESE